VALAAGQAGTHCFCPCDGAQQISWKYNANPTNTPGNIYCLGYSEAL
jgi:hypothetical protein